MLEVFTLQVEERRLVDEDRNVFRSENCLDRAWGSPGLRGGHRVRLLGGLSTVVDSMAGPNGFIISGLRLMAARHN